MVTRFLLREAAWRDWQDAFKGAKTPTEISAYQRRARASCNEERASGFVSWAVRRRRPGWLKVAFAG